MLRALLQLRRVIPESTSDALLRRFWVRHWSRERGRETLKLGRPAPELAGSERAVLCEAVADSYPFLNVLELGCGFGQTFDLLAPLFPKAHFVGIDIDAERVEQARGLAESAARTNVEFRVADAAGLDEFADDCFDLVVSSASLLFLDPARLASALRESARVGRGRLIFLEQHKEGAGLGQRSFENDTRGEYWIRDWRSAAEVLPGAVVNIRKVPNPLWTTERWQDLGCLVEISL